MTDVMRDLRLAIRGLRRNAAVTVAAVVVLAAGIGANTAVFSAVYAILLKPLPYHDPSRLVVALHEGRYPVSPADFLDYKAQSNAFSQFGAAQAWGGVLEVSGRPEVISGLQITANMIPMLGVEPMLGRSFLPGEDAPGRNRVLLLSYGLWQRSFASDRGVVGRTVTLNDSAWTVIGVMPPQFQFAPFWQTEAQMWTPLVLAPRLNDRGGRSLRLFARLASGYSIGQAQSQLSTVAARLAAAHPATNTGVGIQVISLHEKVAGPMRQTLLILLGTAGFVLIIACADIGSLLLARAVARRKEIATRLALGATRFQLGRQLAAESLVLAGLGGCSGLTLAGIATYLLRAGLPAAGLPRQGEIVLHPAVVAFAAVISIAAGFVSGMIPALQSGTGDLHEQLKEGGRSTSEGSAGKTRRRTQSILVTAQVSLALMLLVCAGLLVRTLQHLNAVDAGFNPSHVLTFEARAPEARFDSPLKRRLLFRSIETTLAGMPEVESVSAINHLPVGGDIWSFGYDVPGRPAPPPGHGYGAVYRVVRPNYFRTMQIPILRGRDITAHDDEQAPPVVVINETMAHHQWPGGDPVGQQIVFREPNTPPLALTIIGVVRDARQSDWTGPVDDEVYLPYPQRPGAFGMSAQTFVVRTRSRSESVTSAIAGIGVPVSNTRTMDRVIADKLWRSRIATLLLSGFAAIALALAAMGIYSVISYSVRRRSHELGIRLALGASGADVAGLVLRETLGAVAAGLAAGTAGAAAAVRLLSTLLYGVRPADPATFGAVLLCLIVTAAAATAWPVWQAIKSDPLETLRQ
jgi:putative ABC transport system permease protein